MNRLLTLCFVLGFTIPCAIAQQPPRPAESPLTLQFNQAVAAAQRGDQKQALALTDSLLRQHPNFEPALKLRGMLLEQAGRSAEAAESYQKALKQAPNDAAILYSLGVYQLVAGHYDEAISLFGRHLKLKPRDSDALFYLAQAYHLNGDNQLALATIRQALKLDPDNPSVWQKYGELLGSSGDNQEGLKWLLRAQHADPSLDRIDYDLGAVDYKLMDLPGATQNLTRAVAIHPNDQNALGLLASAEIKLGNWQQAGEAYKRFLANKPGDAESLLGLGHCEVELKDYQAAIDTLNGVLRLDPRRLLAHFYLSRAYAGLGKVEDSQHEAALHHLMMEQATFIRSAETEQRESAIQADTRQLLKEHREADAVLLYEQHFKQTSATIGDAYVFIGKLYLFMGSDEDGLRALHHALEIEPTVRGAHTYEGILALKLGDFNKAEREFQAEIANDPSYQTAIAEMGEVRYRQGRWSDAAEFLAKSKTMTPELLYMLSDADFHLGNVKDADLTAETATAYGRDNPKFLQGLFELLNRNGQSELATRLSASMWP